MADNITVINVGLSEARHDETSKSPVPFRQGKLDRLCGIYALINAFQFAGRANPIRYFPHRSLFSALTAKAAKITGSEAYLHEGLSYKDMGQLAKTAQKFYAAKGHTFNIIRPDQLFTDQPYPKSPKATAERFAWFTQAASTPNIAVIIDLQAPWLWHWSVLAGIATPKPETHSSTSQPHLTLHDSDGMKSVGFEHCTAWRVVAFELKDQMVTKETIDTLKGGTPDRTRAREYGWCL